eukprot:m.190242 g.190242  ORF g.190242 m.190242 type:complete len:160 (-) comp16753_c5_seq1:24-503(-)
MGTATPTQTAEQVMSILSLLATLLPLFVIILWKDWRYARSRFVLVICTTSFAVAILWVAISHLEHEPSRAFEDEKACQRRAVRDFLVWLLLTELTGVIWFTIHSVNVLAPTSRKYEVMLHVICLLAALVAFGESERPSITTPIKPNRTKSKQTGQQNLR